MSAWIFLTLAIFFEVCGTVLLKLSNGFEKAGLGMAAIACYSIWAGMGIFAVTVIGLAFFGQKLGVLQYGFIALILIGAVGLNLTTEIHKTS